MPTNSSRSGVFQRRRLGSSTKYFGKRSVRFFLIIFLGISLSTASAKSETYRFQVFDAVGLFEQEQDVSAFDTMVKSATNGAIQIEIVRLENSIDAVNRAKTANGLAIVWSDSASLPYIDVADLPGVLDSIEAFARVTAEFLATNLRTALRDLDVIYLGGGAFSGIVILVEEPLTSLDDLSGRSISIPLQKHEAVLEALNAKSEQMNFQAQISALQDQRIDAILTWTSSVAAMPEVASFRKYGYDWPFGKLDTWAIIVEAGFWEEFPDDMRNGFERALLEFQSKQMREASAMELSALQSLEELGVVIDGFPAEEMKATQLSEDVFRATWEEWIGLTISRNGTEELARELLARTREFGVASSGSNCPDNQKKCSDGKCKLTC